MVQFDGNYELTGHEGFVDYLISLGPEIPVEVAEKIAEARSVLTVKKEGNRVTFVDVSGPSTTTKIFTVGEFFEEELLKAIKVQSIASVDGNKIILKATSKDGRKGERVYEFSDDGVTIIYTFSGGSKPGKRFYKRI